ncbi:hypothetical protein AQUCO_03600159v1 [Aquilegia coerulea]|uniref:Cytochrome P450 n=1 Tax=Aquilegia coerulea TaxID=218851 RepID=A0A2G5CVR8_AQUCA|nr:hypothetical protein AQUCO_03600159v1 [Aquilegia coerulea]
MAFEVVAGLLLALALCVLWAMIIDWKQHRREELGQLPPGPIGLPVLGNIFQLSWAPHVSFAKLAQTHGSIMTVRLGTMRTIVISSSDVAREMFKNHDTVLAGRKIYEAMRGKEGASEGSIILAQHGPRWRMLRRLCTSEFFVKSRLDTTLVLREKCVRGMVRYVQEASDGGTNNAIDIGRYIYLMSFNLIGNFMFSKDLLDPNSTTGADFFYHAGKIMDLAAKPNIADFLPMLRWLDPQGIKRKSQFHMGKGIQSCGGFIKERMEESKDDAGEKRNDFLDVLLNFRGDGVEEPAMFSPRIINASVMEMFIAGTDTTTSTLEWAMAELLQNPMAMNKAQDELRGSQGVLAENDMKTLPYLTAVIKETLRLHPPLPFLVPHKAMDTCKMFGYYIPKETQILVNVWAIGRDRKSWKDPLIFKPERFLEMNMVDYKGHNFEYLPFGSGRRICPAIPLVSLVLPLALGSLMYSFDWVLPNGLKPENMDMSERLGITLRKAVPLKVLPVPYKGNPICKVST